MSRIAAVNVTIGDRCFLAGDAVPDEYAATVADPAVWTAGGDAESESEPPAKSQRKSK